MSISGLGSQDQLVTSLTAKGLSATKAKLVDQDLADSIKAVSTSGTKPDTAKVRDALNQRMAADVAAGTLTQKDADAVNKTLDDRDAAAGNAAGAAAAPADQAEASGGGKGSGGGGGGGGSATKTELYRTVVVSGSMKTTTITYTDETTKTETTASNGASSSKSDDAKAASSDQSKASSQAKAYGDDVPPGSLIDEVG